MGSIVTYYPFENWVTEKTFSQQTLVVVGEIDDYKTEDIKTLVDNDIYNRLKSGELKLETRRTDQGKILVALDKDNLVVKRII